MLFSGCTALGFYFSRLLTKRRKTLHRVCMAFNETAHLVEMGKERSQIIEKVFCQANLRVTENEDYTVTVDSDSLKKEDVSLLNEFFSRFGTSDVLSQISLCETYKNLFNNLFESAREEEKTKGQVYKTCGVLTAVALVIFVM